MERPVPERTPNIAVLAGYWSTNIGNAFFQLGAQWLLQSLLPQANVFLIGDQPGYWNVKRGNPAHALDYAAHLKIDAIVVLGPFVRPEMEGITGELLRRHHARGTKIIILAAGMMQYDDATIGLARRLLSECPPWIFTTRDRQTYDALGDLAEHAYDGIDVATFVSDLFPRVPTDLPPYVVLNFDQIPEPRFAQREGSTSPGVRSFEWEGKPWTAASPRLRTELSYRFRAFPFADSFLPGGRLPTELAGRTIIRTDHRYNPFLPRKTYKAPASYAGDIPHSYLSLYANSTCTFSNRVHACVATVSYGRPAMLFTRSPRAYLLSRLGLDTIKDRPTALDPAFLASEKAGMMNYLRPLLQTLARSSHAPAPAPSVAGLS